MSFKFSALLKQSPQKRVALYLRVSTGRQAAGDVSIPSQRDLTRGYCEGQGWLVVREFVEPGASATDDRRPVFQRMLELAASSERDFDIICVHAFSRFYRNGAEMELCIRKLRKLGIEVVSMTQPTGDDPSQNLMRQIIGIFDEYTSSENGKNVTRAMRESAKQGFWNGAKPPLGYRIVEAERRGSKIKKRLEIDPVDADLVRLIFRLYAEGDGTTGPLGVKDTAKWLNSHGYRTRSGACFGVGPIHGILTNTCYATGQWPYGVRNSRTGTLHDPSTIVHIEVPAIIDLGLFERVKARLCANNPRVNPPRVVNGPTLLTGLAVCAECGSGMTRTGTSRGHRVYTYYSCAGCQQKGKSVCKGRHIPMPKLDELILHHVKQQLFTPERLKSILAALMERRSLQDLANAEPRASLEASLTQVNDKLGRLYKAIEEGIVELDQELKDRVSALKNEKALIEASLERLITHAQSQSQISPERIEAFAELMRTKLDTGDTQARKTYLRSVISQIEIGDQKIRIIGNKSNLAGLIVGQTTQAQNVSGFVRKWRAQGESNPCFRRERATS